MFRINIRTQTVFEVQPPRSSDVSALDSHLWGHTYETLLYPSPIDNEETLYQHIFDTCLTIRNWAVTSLRLGQSMFKGSHACNTSDGGQFEHLL